MSMPLHTAMALLLAFGFLYLVARLFEWRSVYHPTRRMIHTPSDAGLVYEDVYFTAEDGKDLHGWWVPSEKSRGVLLYCHGNAGNISDRIEIMVDMHQLDLDLFMFDYRGYGKSKGLPTEHGTYRDAHAAYDWVCEKCGTEHPPLILYGCSLGGAVAIDLASQHPVKGLVVECSFSSIADMATHLYPWLPLRRIAWTQYKSEEKIGSVAAPVLIAHSPDDRVVPYELGRRLFEAAAEPKTFVDLQGGHLERGYRDTPAFAEALRGFVAQAL